MIRKKTVKEAIFETLQNQIDAGSLTLEQLFKPRRWGQCNDYAMIIQAITFNSGLTNEVIREETVLRYVRLFKKHKKSEYESQNNAVAQV